MFGFFILLLFSVCLLLLFVQTFWSLVEARHTGAFPWKIWMIEFYDSFQVVFPFITILSALFMFSEMERSGQILVFKLHGISELQIFITFIFFGFLCSILSFIAGNFPPYPGQQHRNKAIMPLNFTTNEVFFYAEHWTEQRGENVIFEMKRNNLFLTCQARKARFFERSIVFYDGSVSYRDGIRKDFDLFALDVDFNPLAVTEYAFSFLERQSFFRLRSILKAVERVGVRSVIDWIILYSKISYPVLNIFVIMILIPFFFAIKNLSRVKVFIIAFVLTLVIYVLYSAGISLGKAGIIPWQISPWISHFMLFCFFGIYLSYIRVKMYNL
ncbi:MAG: LptF/LptG family permease [Candidatus Omnitrophica bacterium]|nr:LptF/LptG family permease [Candidatus Omnitrophota bacterium]